MIRASVIGLAVYASSIGVAIAGWDSCGSLKNHYGPYDYRTERTGKLRIVEQFHFTPEVEALIRGHSGYLGEDLDYTLRTSPNHHRALLALSRFGERTKSPQPPHLQWSIDCYFERATRFEPDDIVVHLLFAQYLGKTGRVQEATQRLGRAEELAKDDPLAHYNIGLIYFELKEYDRALVEAHRAIRLGYLRAELPDMLRSVGKWREPASDTAATASGAASAPASAASSTP